MTIVIKKYPPKKLIIEVLFPVLCISLLLLIYFENKKKTVPVEVFVAAQDIPAEIFLKPEMIIKNQLPAYMASPDNIDDFQEVDGLTTLVPIPKGKPILYTQFSPTEKAQGPSRSHNPLNYTLSVDEITGIGKLYRPGVNFYFFGKVSTKTNAVPIAVFQKVNLTYQNPRLDKPHEKTHNTIHLFSITTAQAEALKKLKGQPLDLFLKVTNGEEIEDFEHLSAKQR